MEKEMDMVQKMGIPVVLVIGTQNKFNFIQMMEQSLLIIQQQVNKQWGFDTTSNYDISPNMSKTFNFPVSFSNNCFVVLPVLYGSWAGCVVWARFKDLTKCTLGFEEWANNTQGVHVGYLAIGN